MDATESVLRPGYRLDRYELLCPIATGGMATVWLARLRGKRGFEKLFAIKTIRTELVDDPQFEEMFLDEARIASSILHPNVAQILDLGEQDGVLFIVMEWVDGDSLAKIRRLLAKRDAKLPVGIVLRVLSDACAGLHAAHELKGGDGQPLEIVHRDVSPHNILVASSGSAKIIDFGIAKAHNRKQGETRTGVVKGKVHYMAPEQVNKGGQVDRRADIWALGMCLHELVVGKLPHGGEDDIGVIRKLMTAEAPAIAPETPAPIRAVLEQAIALDPNARFATASAMQRALEQAMKELGAGTSSEDVAAFLRSQLPELESTRRQAVGKAIEEARERGTLDAESGEDVAFAATVVSDQQLRSSAGRAQQTGRQEPRAIALTRRKAPRAVRGSIAALEESQVTSAALEQDPIVIPKRSRAWMWLMLLGIVGGVAFAAASGATARLPAAVTRALTTLGWTGAARPEPGTPPKQGAEPSRIPATASSVETHAAPVSASTASATASASADSHLLQEAGASARAGLPTPMIPAVAPMLDPSTEVAVPVPAAPSDSASLPPPAPTTSGDDENEDPNNPYN